LNLSVAEGNVPGLAEGLSNFLEETDEFYKGTKSVMTTDDWKKTPAVYVPAGPICLVDSLI
jgi:hypothetical protein